MVIWSGTAPAFWLCVETNIGSVLSVWWMTWKYFHTDDSMCLLCKFVNQTVLMVLADKRNRKVSAPDNNQRKAADHYRTLQQTSALATKAGHGEKCLKLTFRLLSNDKWVFMVTLLPSVLSCTEWGLCRYLILLLFLIFF